MLDALVRHSLAKSSHRKIAAKLFEKIRRLWKSRNFMLHSHYVYVIKHEDGGTTILKGIGKDLGTHPSKLGPQL